METPSFSSWPYFSQEYPEMWSDVAESIWCNLTAYPEPGIYGLRGIYLDNVVGIIQKQIKIS